MKKYDWKKLKWWKVGSAAYEVVMVKKIPKKYNKPRSKESDCVAVTDLELKKIYMESTCLNSFQFFLENLFHELEHATEYQSAAEYMGKETDEDLRTELMSAVRLQVHCDNVKNFEYINLYFKERNKSH